MMPRIITCARCGNEVVATGPCQKYCPLCAYHLRLERQNERRSARRENAQHTKIITCEICGKEVAVSSKATQAKYCPECSTKAYASSRKKSRKKEVKRGRPDTGKTKPGELIESTCSLCGEKFSYYYTGYYRSRCPDCKNRKKGIHRYLEERTKPRESKIEEKQRAAQVAGMSYGKYVAMMAMKKGA